MTKKNDLVGRACREKVQFKTKQKRMEEPIQT